MQLIITITLQTSAAVPSFCVWSYPKKKFFPQIGTYANTQKAIGGCSKADTRTTQNASLNLSPTLI